MEAVMFGWRHVMFTSCLVKPKFTCTVFQQHRQHKENCHQIIFHLRIQQFHVLELRLLLSFTICVFLLTIIGDRRNIMRI